MSPETTTAAGRYQALSTRRQPFLDNAREASKYTIPTMIPPAGNAAGGTLYKPHQSVGARCVNNLANKLLLTLLPPTRKFFRYVPSNDLKDAAAPGELSAIEAALVKLEDRVLKEIERRALRVHYFEALRHLVVAGNVAINISKSACRVFPLSQYVARRTPEGDLREIIVNEKIAFDEIPADIQQKIKERCQEGESPEDTYDLYTRVVLEAEADGKERWYERQEVAGFAVEGSEADYPKDKLPWIVLRGSRIDGEDYGRSHVDDYIGDFRACEALSRSMQRSAAIAAKTVFLVNPNGSTDIDDLVEAEEGGFVNGIPDEVKALQADRFADMQTAKSVLDDIVSRLSFGFLLNSAIQRQGERVTAEEIRFMASELEDGVGGLYSILSIELQLPTVRIVSDAMIAVGDFPKLKEKTVEPTVITGIDALGRSHELARLDALMQGALQTFGAQALPFFKLNEYLRRRAAGLDIDPTGLILTDEEVAQQQRAAMEQQVLSSIGPDIAKGVMTGAAPGATPANA